MIQADERLASLKSAIRREAESAGFTDIGFAPARFLDEDARRMDAWVASGRHGEMDWLADRPRRRATVSAWVRTIIVTTTAYPVLDWRPGEKKYASYAEGEDYHETILERLKPLAILIRSNGGRAKRLVDTGALFERAWAREAGLGFIGRNTMLIARRGGPAVLLSLILTDLVLPPDLPDADSSGPRTETCGECVRCLEACPTGALDAQGLDARRCISYLTIELKRPMTEEERAKTGDWTFGCDECLTSCPYTVRGLPVKRPVARGATRFGK